MPGASRGAGGAFGLVTRALRRLRLVVLIVEGMSFGKHPLMQDAGNQNAATFLPVKQDMLAMLVTVHAGANVIANAT